jgi:hypothetical protein
MLYWWQASFIAGGHTPMEVDDYQRAAARTLIDKPDFILTQDHAEVAATMIRLGAHIGRILEYVKKGIFHQHGFSMHDFCILLDDIVRVDTTSTVALDDDAVMMIWNTIGYIGEACEVAALLEQSILQGMPLDVAALGKELGDGGWYSAALGTRAGLRLSDILAANLDKLRTRYPNGYSAADSVARVDVAAPVNHVVISKDGAVAGFDSNLRTATIRNEYLPADYMANLTFDGKVLLSTDDSEPVLGDKPAKPLKTLAELIPRIAELCGACLEYKDQDTMTTCHCGADICAECAADGVTRCYICSDGGSIC